MSGSRSRAVSPQENTLLELNGQVTVHDELLIRMYSFLEVVSTAHQSPQIQGLFLKIDCSSFHFRKLSVFLYNKRGSFSSKFNLKRV